MHRIVSAFTHQHQNAQGQHFLTSHPSHCPEGGVLSGLAISAAWSGTEDGLGNGTRWNVKASSAMF